MSDKLLAMPHQCSACKTIGPDECCVCQLSNDGICYYSVIKPLQDEIDFITNLKLDSYYITHPWVMEAK